MGRYTSLALSPTDNERPNLPIILSFSNTIVFDSLDVPPLGLKTGIGLVDTLGGKNHPATVVLGGKVGNGTLLKR